MKLLLHVCKLPVLFLLLHFGAYDLQEAKPVDSICYCLDLSPNLSQYFRFFLYRSSPAPSRPSSSKLYVGVPAHSLFLYGREIFPQCTPDTRQFQHLFDCFQQ